MVGKIRNEKRKEWERGDEIRHGNTARDGSRGDRNSGYTEKMGNI